jgi:hypothetical protein
MSNRNKYFVLAGLALICAAIIAGPGVLHAVDSLTWEGVLPHIYSGATGDGAINIAMTESTVGLDVSDETALTNTVDDVIDLTHTTTGSPANSIGAGITFHQETTANNTEAIMEVNAVVTDVTAASEDAKFSVELMAAGAAAAEKFSIGSTGIITAAGGATLDNATSAAVLNITEDTIKQTGWDVYNYGTVTAVSYTLASTGKASYYIQTVGEAATFHLDTDLLTTPGAGCKITVKTGGANDVTIDTEGAEDIDGADTYSLDGAYEAVTLTNDGTNWFVLSGYLE